MPRARAVDHAPLCGIHHTAMVWQKGRRGHFWRCHKKNLEVNMALEFRTRDENYKGPSVLPSGAAILQASVFVDHLPPGFSTDPYNPYLVNDRYSHRPRYVIDTNMMVRKDFLALVGVHPKGLASTNSETVRLIANTSIERDGLD